MRLPQINEKPGAHLFSEALGFVYLAILGFNYGPQDSH
jgi:hypothetical protein